jgi:hypothetical protein
MASVYGERKRNFVGRGHRLLRTSSGMCSAIRGNQDTGGSQEFRVQRFVLALADGSKKIA